MLLVAKLQIAFRIQKASLRLVQKGNSKIKRAREKKLSITRVSTKLYQNNKYVHQILQVVFHFADYVQFYVQFLPGELKFKKCRIVIKEYIHIQNISGFILWINNNFL
jgi:hypothetical protein